jgi:hypothetical protein
MAEYNLDQLDEFFKRDPKIFTDNGFGITEESIKYFKSLEGKLGQIFQINLDQHRNFAVEIQCSAGTVLLSGLSCGYGGTGPNGMLDVMTMIGLKSEEYKEKIFQRDQSYLDVRNKMVFY